MRGAPPVRASALVTASPAPARPASPRPAPARPPRPVEPEAAPIDPRISARRIAVRRDEGRRRLRKLTWLGVVVVLVAGAFGATRTPLLDLDHVRVDGAAHLGEEPVLAAMAEAGVRPGQPLVDLDLGGAEAALEALPGVQDAELVRRWPGTVEVHLIERVPAAAVAVNGGRAVVGADGIVLAVEPSTGSTTSGLVLVDGPATLAVGDRFESTALVAVAAALPPSVVPLVSGVGFGDGEGTVELRLVAGGVVRIGTVDQLGAKLQAVETVLAQADTSCLAVLDVRVPSPATVTRRPSCGAQSDDTVDTDG